MAKTHFRLPQLPGILGLSDHPYFGDIARETDQLATLFKFRADLVEETADRMNSNIDTKIVLVTGSPGVGKSTFLEYMAKCVFPERMKRISLASRLPSIADYDYVPISKEQIIYILRRIESFLLNILRRHSLDLPSRHADGREKLQQVIEATFRNAESADFDEKIEIVKELSRDYILPLCKRISASKLKEKYYLAIDDVDYLYPHHQTDILGVLMSIAELTTNPIVLYSARPVAGKVAQSYISRYLHHQTSGSPIVVKPIPIMSVVDGRFQAVSIGSSFKNIFADTKVRDLIEGLSSNNIRAGLKCAEHAYHEAKSALTTANLQYDFDSIVAVLYGSPTENKDSSDIGDDGSSPLINILRSIKPGDPVPYEFVALYTLMSPKNIDGEYFSLFNECCAKINPTESIKPVSDVDILNILRVCHQEDLISRKEHINFDHIPRNIESYNYRNRLENHVIEVSMKGRLLLELVGEPLYQRLTALDTWRRLVSDNIKIFARARK